MPLTKPCAKAFFSWPIRLVREAVKAPIHLYRIFLSPMLGAHCRFYPTCSCYALEAIEIKGIWRGCRAALWRLLRCGPWSAGGYDPVCPVKDKQ